MFIELEYIKASGDRPNKALFNTDTISRAYPNSDGSAELYCVDGAHVTALVPFTDLRRLLLEMAAGEQLKSVFGR